MRLLDDKKQAFLKNEIISLRTFFATESSVSLIMNLETSDPRTVRAGEPQVRIGPRFSNFSRSWSELVLDFLNLSRPDRFWSMKTLRRFTIAQNIEQTRRKSYFRRPAQESRQTPRFWLQIIKLMQSS